MMRVIILIVIIVVIDFYDIFDGHDTDVCLFNALRVLMMVLKAKMPVMARYQKKDHGGTKKEFANKKV